MPRNHVHIILPSRPGHSLLVAGAAGLFALIVLNACGAEPGALDEPSPDTREAAGITAGKADGSSFTACELEEIVGFLNRPEMSAEALREAGVHPQAAYQLAVHRAGPDGLVDSGDDRFFETAEEVDNVDFVGPAAMRQLADAVADRCALRAPGTVEAIFSPAAWEESHLARTVTEIDAAQRSVDVAMYSFRDSELRDALARAVGRGVCVRVLLDTASADRHEPEGTMSASLEELGIDVRWVNKIMHHKFALIDGPRTFPMEALGATLVTGSANWSWSAATRYDENTVVIRGNGETILRFQQEFNLLWEHSRDFVWGPARERLDSVPIADADIPDGPAIDTVFTSTNFRVYDSSRYGPTFATDGGERAAASRLAELIGSATRSVDIASGHLRSWPIYRALVDLHERRPEVRIRVYLDGQEYISEWAYHEEQRELRDCLAAVAPGAEEDCHASGQHYGYPAALAGIPVRYQYYAYRWDYRYAVQMHHKYVIIDGRTLATGSYNLSDNAEFDSFENVVIYDGSAYPRLVADFQANFERIWTTGHAENLYDRLLDQIRAAETASGEVNVPLVFEPMALDWDQITALKQAIREACPAVDSEAFRTAPADNRTCTLE